MKTNEKSQLLSAVLPVARVRGQNRKYGFALLLASTVLSPFAISAPALAADSPPAAQQSGEETVVVTASRRSETVQNVGGEVTALTSADLAQMHANTFSDFASTVPGLSFQSNSPTNNLVAIRGVASSTAELGSAIGLYLDDVPLGASTQFGLGSQSFNINLFDMNRVEVLNGPQGTLYGANSLGGALKYITAKPDPTGFDAQAEVEGSSTDHGAYNDGLRVMVNVPFLDGKAAIRVDGLQEFDSGYTQDPAHGRKDIGSARALGGRISLFAQITPDLDVRLGIFSQNTASNGLDVGFYDPFTHKPVAGALNQSFALRQPSDNSLTLYSGVLNWDFHWAKLTSITGYQINHGTYDTDVSTFYDTLFSFFVPPASTVPYDLYVDTNTKKFTQEVRLASPDNKNFEWVVGGYYTREITEELVDLKDGASADGNLPAPFNAFAFYGFLPSSYREIAAFADGTYYFSDDFDVTLGVRYSTQHQVYKSNIWWLLYGPPYGKVYPYGKPSNQSVATYLINPRYRLSDDTMLYARISSGYRPGGPNFFPPPFPSTFQPDTLWNYELGEKSTLLDGKATVDFDIYDIEWQGIQTTENVNGINQLVNAGNARIQGAETSLGYRILPQLSLTAAAAFTDAHLTTTAPVLGVFYKGARLPLSPKYNFTLGATYNFELGDGYSGAANVSDVFVGDRTSGYAGSPTNVLYKMPSYNTVNVNLSFFMPHNIELDAYVKNVFDEHGQISAGTLNNVFIPDAPVPVTLSLPRTIGLVLKVGLDK